LLVISIDLLLVSRSSRRIQSRGIADWLADVVPVALPATQPINATPVDFHSPVFPVVVTADNWREINVRLNNVYTDPAVLAARNQAMGQFAAYMEVSDHQITWRQRNGMRAAAVAKLKQSEPDLQRIVQQSAGPARDEAALALIEIQYNAQEYQAITHTAADLIHRMSPGRPRDLAYEYLIQSCNCVRDRANMQKYETEMRSISPLAIGELFGNTPTGLLGSMILRYQGPQLMDDTTLMEPGTPLAASSAAQRDQLRQGARQSFEMVKRLWLQLPQNQRAPRQAVGIS